MRAYRYLQVDVFTDRVFGGNLLAVFPEAEGLTDGSLYRRCSVHFCHVGRLSGSGWSFPSTAFTP